MTNTTPHLLAVLNGGGKVLAGQSLVQVPEDDDPLLVANEELVVVRGTQLQALHYPRVRPGSRLNPEAGGRGGGWGARG